MTDRALVPPRIPGLLVAPYGTGAAVYDTDRRRVTFVSDVAGLVLSSSGFAVRDVIAELVDATGRPTDEVTEVVARTIDELEGAGLVRAVEDDGAAEPGPSLGADRDGEAVGSEGDATRLAETDRRGIAGQSRRGLPLSTPLAMFDDRLVFRSTDASLLRRIDEWLGVVPSDEGGPPTRVFEVEPRGDGGFDVEAAESWAFPDEAGLRSQLPGVVHDFAVRVAPHLVLHAGGVRHADGSVTVLAGRAEAGKSTLTAALVAEGADYLGDELIGVRGDLPRAVGFPLPPALDQSSLEVLGRGDLVGLGLYGPVARLRAGVELLSGDAGPIARVVVPRFDASAESVTVERLEREAALDALLVAAMNLVGDGDEGWATLCALAENVPVVEVRYPDAMMVAKGGHLEHLV